MKNVALKLIDDKRTFRQMNGAMYLRNDEAGIENVSLKIGTTDLAFNGVFKNIINYFKKDGNLTANVEVKSKFIDVQDLGTTSKEEKIQEEKKIYDKIKEENINKIILTNIILSGIIYEYMK